jgi:hypothetical protein
MGDNRLDEIDGKSVLAEADQTAARVPELEGNAYRSAHGSRSVRGPATRARFPLVRSLKGAVWFGWNAVLT